MGLSARANRIGRRRQTAPATVSLRDYLAINQASLTRSEPSELPSQRPPHTGTACPIAL